MKFSVVAGQRAKQFVISNIADATHYRVKGERPTEYAITAVHTITAVPAGKTILKVEHNGTLRPLEQVHLLREAFVDGTPDYQIKLTEDEAKVLSEILRNTRGGTGVGDPIHSVVNELFHLLPHGHDGYENTINGLINIRKKGK